MAWLQKSHSPQLNSKCMENLEDSSFHQVLEGEAGEKKVKLQPIIKGIF